MRNQFSFDLTNLVCLNPGCRGCHRHVEGGSIHMQLPGGSQGVEEALFLGGLCLSTPHMRQSVGDTVEWLLQSGCERSPPMDSKERLDWANGLWSSGRLWEGPGAIKTASWAHCYSLGFAAVYWFARCLLCPGPRLPFGSPVLAGSCSPSHLSCLPPCRFSPSSLPGLPAFNPATPIQPSLPPRSS